MGNLKGKIAGGGLRYHRMEERRSGWDGWDTERDGVREAAEGGARQGKEGIEGEGG